MQLSIDQMIGDRYKIISKLGQGGMGEVWKAHDQQLGDEVVIKLPLENSDPIVLQRFSTEAKMMRQHSLDNPNILDIQGMGNIDGTPYYVMRHLPGGSLEDRCPIVDSKGKPDFRPESYEWLGAIAKALDFLHSKGVLHRDVKPANILFNNSGTAYLADFGIVKTPLEATNFSAAPTAANTSPGTIEYMPPEVLSGDAKSISGTGDQYALAVTLYEMINGSRPFTGPTETAIFLAIDRGAKPLHEVMPTIPQAASDVVSRALDSNPDKRFATCNQFAKTFSDALISHSPKANAPVLPISLEVADGTRKMDLEKYRKQLKHKADDKSRAISLQTWIGILFGGLICVAGLVLAALYLPGMSETPKSTTNSIGMEFRLIPAGTFMMGSPDNEPNRVDDELQHEIVISKGFYIGLTEVTQGQWKEVMGTEPWKGKEDVKESHNYAAVHVNWHDAVNFCRILSQREGHEYRLPTEAEWEFACRGGTQSAYSFGSDPNSLEAHAFFMANSNYAGTDVSGSDRREGPAGYLGTRQKIPNPFGLFDMHGNVWEWCIDRYESGYYSESQLVDPQGPDTGDSQVTRGGSWDDGAMGCRSAFRSKCSPQGRLNSLGFRVVRSTSKEPNRNRLEAMPSVEEESDTKPSNIHRSEATESEGSTSH